MNNVAPLYDDGRILCDDDGITIRWYYLWGPKRIPYRTIHTARKFQLNSVRGKWRVWGSGDLVHWYNLDPGRPGKQTGIELDTGHRIHPCITPEDAEAVSGIIDEHLAGPTG